MTLCPSPLYLTPSGELQETALQETDHVRSVSISSKKASEEKEIYNTPVQFYPRQQLH